MIPFGKENAVSRQTLSKMSGLPDRSVRELIEDARRNGSFIINDQDGKGYYRTFDLDIIERQLRADSKRAKSIFARMKYMRRFLKAYGREVN